MPAVKCWVLCRSNISRISEWPFLLSPAHWTYCRTSRLIRRFCTRRCSASGRDRRSSPTPVEPRRARQQGMPLPHQLWPASMPVPPLRPIHRVWALGSAVTGCRAIGTPELWRGPSCIRTGAEDGSDARGIEQPGTHPGRTSWAQEHHLGDR